MKYISTRGQVPAILFHAALTAGLAADGGLFVPQEFPRAAELPANLSLSDFAARVLTPMVEPDGLLAELPAICATAFNFPIPLRLRADGGVLELFHGPTAAFKDVGARFLAECLARTRDPGLQTVIVATSGDTGGAVAAAFAHKPGFEVIVLYPKGKISARQELQITTWGDRVRAFAVNGTFDDCQRVVKAALRDPTGWATGEATGAAPEAAPEAGARRLISANSISVGRLLPQMIYYAKASLSYFAARGVAPGFIVPTGNLGNGVAALWAKKMGFPIRQVVLATNANSGIVDYFSTGAWRSRPTTATLANAMDVAEPSNFERLTALYSDLEALKVDVAAVSVSDAEIIAAIRGGGTEVWCPHTATAVVAERKLGGRDWVLVATAHPAKFETIVEPLLGRALEIPTSLKTLLGRAPRSVALEPTLAALKARMR